LNKTKIISSVAKECGISRLQAEKIIEATLGHIVTALRNDENVLIAGFGSFRVSQRAARTGVNPRTLKTVQISAAKVPKFSAGSALKKAVNA
jgi:DNA-binding protein HU-beta